MEINETIRCYTRLWYTPSPALKKRSLIFDLSAVSTSSKRVEYMKQNCHVCGSSRRCVTSCTRSTQTVTSVDESNREDGLNVIFSKPIKSSQNIDRTNRKPPAKRNLTMDSVIDELKDKFRVNYCNKNISIDNRDRNSDDELESSTIYPIPKLTRGYQSFSGNDFTSEETATQTTGSLSENSPKQSNSSDCIESHIGEVFEGCESMSEKPSSPYIYSEIKLDSYILSDILSNTQINDDSIDDSDMTVSFHSNLTKRATLVSNNFVRDTGSSLAICKIADTIEIDFLDTAHSTSCEESKTTEIDLNLTSRTDDTVPEYNSLGVRTNTCQTRDDDEIVLGEKSVGCTHHDGCDQNESDRSCSDKETTINLIIDGKDLYRFYKEFDPNEIFQIDSENVSLQAHYDNQSLQESGTDDGALTCISEEEVFTTDENDDLLVLVNENIFTGKKYLLSRYLSGNIHHKMDSAVENEFLYDTYKSKNETKNNGEICCGTSEDSAIYSGLTIKTLDGKVNRPDKIDSNKVIEWSLSDNSKGGNSDISSGSSGIRLSSTSEDDNPKKPAISSIDEFVIKEIVCNNCPSHSISPCNSYNSFPLKRSGLYSNHFSNLSRSLPNIFLADTCSSNNIKNYFKFDTYKMPNLSTIFSYYTLVPYNDKNLSLPDLTNQTGYIKKKSVVSPLTENYDNISNRNGSESEFDDRGVYISDDFICCESDSGKSDSCNTLPLMDGNSFEHFATCHNNREEGLSTSEHQFSESNRIGFLLAGSEHEPLKEAMEENEESIKIMNYEVDFLNKGCATIDSNECIIARDCIKCFTTSLDESFDDIFSNKKRMNKILQSLKKKFKPHNCIDFQNYRNPFKFNVNKKSNKHYSKGNRSNNYATISKFGRVIKKNRLVFNSKIPTESVSPDRSILFGSCKSDTMKVTCNVNYLQNYECVNEFTYATNEENIKGTCDDINETDHYEEEWLLTDSGGDRSVISSQGESFFSLPTSSVSSDWETFYSVGSDYIAKCAFTNNDSDVLSKQECYLSFSNAEHNLCSIKTQNEMVYNNAENSYCISESVDYGSDGSLEDSVVNVSTVSCQTDESFREDNELVYHPNDYKEDYTSSTSVDDSGCVPEFHKTSENCSFSHSLYTIYETSRELSPDY